MGFSGKLKDGIHVARPAGKMDGNNGLGPGRENGLDRLRCNVLSGAIHIGNDGTRTAHDGTTGGSDKCSTGSDDFVAWTDAESVESKFQRGRPIGQRDCVLGADKGRELLLELAAFFARPVVHLSRLQNTRSCLDLVRRKVRPGGE